MKRKTILICCQILLSGYLIAQTDYELVNKRFQSNKPSIQLQAGSNGMGAGLRYQFLDKFAVRFNATYFGTTINQPFNGNSENAGLLGDLKSDIQYLKGSVSQIGILGEFNIFSTLRLVAGGAYINNTEFSGYLKPSKGIDFDNLNISPDQIGNLAANISFNGVAPYFGLGIGKSTPSKRFGVNVDLGTYYMQQPKVQIDATKLLTANKEHESLLENNLSDYRWLPTIQLNLNFKLGK